MNFTSIIVIQWKLLHYVMMKSSVFDFSENYVGLSHHVCYKRVQGTSRENVVHTHHEGVWESSFIATFIHDVCPGWGSS